MNLIYEKNLVVIIFLESMNVGVFLSPWMRVLIIIICVHLSFVTKSNDVLWLNQHPVEKNVNHRKWGSLNGLNFSKTATIVQNKELRIRGFDKGG